MDQNEEISIKIIIFWLFTILGKFSVMVQKKTRKNFGQFFGRFQRKEASSFFGSDPPRVFCFPWGGVLGVSLFGPLCGRESFRSRRMPVDSCPPNAAR